MEPQRKPRALPTTKLTGTDDPVIIRVNGKSEDQVDRVRHISVTQEFIVAHQ